VIDDARGHPEVVVLDVAVPAATGPEVLRTLRTRPEHVHLPAISLPARVRPEDIAAPSPDVPHPQSCLDRGSSSAPQVPPDG
jgi:CheY-like chemotaxis protein